MRQVMEKLMEVLVSNDVIYSKHNMLRIAQILMAQAVSMVGMSSNNMKEFRDNTKKLIEEVTTVLEGMDHKERAALMDRVGKNLDWFEDQRDKLSNIAEEEVVEEVKDIKDQQED